jgi:hypothetical protein
MIFSGSEEEKKKTNQKTNKPQSHLEKNAKEVPHPSPNV